MEKPMFEQLIFPRFHGHRVKSPSPWLRTRRESDSRGSNAGGLGLEVSDVKKLCQLEEENRRLKQMVAEQALDIQAL
jgi:hypothetical protein